MKDISKELGISITTISFIVNKKAKNKISKEVIKKVEDYIEKVGYKPNSSAQSLRTGKSKTILFMAEDISDPFFSAIAKEMEEIAFNNGYKIIYCSTENKKDRAIELLNLFRDRQVDAYIITPPEHFEEEIRKLIYHEQQHVMLFDRCYNSFEHNYVVLENLKGAKDATLQLINSGRKKIAFVGIDSDLSPLTERRMGYEKAIQENGFETFSLFITFDQIKTQQGRNLIDEFLRANPGVDAILFATNNLAISGLRVLREKKMKIPDEIAIISFDERDIFELYNPPISVVAQPVRELANELINGTLKMLNRKSLPATFFCKSLHAELIMRESLPVRASSQISN